MIYQSTSMFEVIARVIRNTRVQDAGYLKDMEEWIPEAMGYMRTRYVTRLTFKDVNIAFHRGKYPCDLIAAVAVQHGGCRLRYYSGSIAANGFGSSSNADSVYPGIPVYGQQAFGTHLVKRPAVDKGVPVEFYETDIRAVQSLPEGDAWYYSEMGFINTSFEKGCVRVHYRGIPVDEQGLPLIPDEENYKQALYWYCRAMMIGAGFEDKVFREEVCMQRYEEAAGRAMSRITYPSVDEMDAKVERLTRFILPADYWSSFFNPAGENRFDY